MYAYLMRQRHIDREVISYFVHEKLLYEDKHHNCVFVGLDGSGEAKHAHIRSTSSGTSTSTVSASLPSPDTQYAFKLTENSYIPASSSDTWHTIRETVRRFRVLPN